MGEESYVSSAIGVFLLSLLGIPATYIVNTAQTLNGEQGLLISGTITLSSLCVLTYFVLSRSKQPKDWLFYGKKFVFVLYWNVIINCCHYHHCLVSSLG
jgi:hypothetical protein